MLFSEFRNLKKVDQIVVLISEAALSKASLLHEGRWVASGKQDWMMRVDPADPSIPSLRHVHIARSRHTSAKNQQASWNDDKSRHDKGSFNGSVGSLKVVQNIARSALGLPSDAILEHIVSPRKILVESANQSSISIIYLTLTSV